MFLNAEQYGLPQSRPRAFTVGHRIDLFGQRFITAPPKFHRTVPIAKLLDVSDDRDIAPNIRFRTRI